MSELPVKNTGPESVLQDMLSGSLQYFRVSFVLPDETQPEALHNKCIELRYAGPWTKKVPVRQNRPKKRIQHNKFRWR